MKRRGQRRSSVSGSVAELFPPPGQWTEDDYFALPDTNRYVELSEGRLVVPPHPTRRHQTAVGELYLRLQTFVQAHALGWVFLAPLPVRLWPGKIREPDIFFIAREHADRLGERFCGVPELVVEVLSPQTRRTDRSEKFYEYARAGSRNTGSSIPTDGRSRSLPYRKVFTSSSGTMAPARSSDPAGWRA